MGGGGGGGCTGFQVTGIWMIEGFFRDCKFRFRDFFGQENFGKYLFW